MIISVGYLVVIYRLRHRCKLGKGSWREKSNRGRGWQEAPVRNTSVLWNILG